MILRCKTVCPFQVVFAQQMPGPNPIHPDAVPGSTSQRQQAWESMTPQQQDQAVQDLQQIIQQTQYQPNSPYSPNDKYEQETVVKNRVRKTEKLIIFLFILGYSLFEIL